MRSGLTLEDLCLLKGLVQIFALIDVCFSVHIKVLLGTLLYFFTLYVKCTFTTAASVKAQDKLSTLWENKVNLES